MLNTLLKYTIYDLCIDQFFNTIIKNFISPREMLIVKQVVSRLVCSDTRNGFTFVWCLYNAHSIDSCVINGMQCIRFECNRMRMTQIDNTGNIGVEETTYNNSLWISEDMVMNIDI